jgi:hypothetical protein
MNLSKMEYRNVPHQSACVAEEIECEKHQTKLHPIAQQAHSPAKEVFSRSGVFEI